MSPSCACCCEQEETLLQQQAGRAFQCCDQLLFIFAAARYDCVIHFAGRKYVNESVDNPLRYYDHNVLGTVQLVKTCIK